MEKRRSKDITNNVGQKEAECYLHNELVYMVEQENRELLRRKILLKATKEVVENYDCLVHNS